MAGRPIMAQLVRLKEAFLKSKMPNGHKWPIGPNLESGMPESLPDLKRRGKNGKTP